MTTACEQLQRPLNDILNSRYFFKGKKKSKKFIRDTWVCVDLKQGFEINMRFHENQLL